MKPILPGSVIGLLGSGQLGRMFAIAARRLGYRVHTYSPDEDTPTGQIADIEVSAPYTDLDRVRQFAHNVDVVTFEFENVPADAAAACAEACRVRPDGRVLHTTQHRLREKTFLSQNGFPVAPFRPINNAADLTAALEQLGTPAILKTAGFGYDGKGQYPIKSAEDAPGAWASLNNVQGVLEGYIDFQCELSVVAARGQDGAFSHYGAVQNEHANGILSFTTVPAPIDARTAKEAVEIARAVLETLDVVGVLCVEFFLTRSGRLLINELAPRPHNSGHFTFDACVTSQFEQQLRAVCGLPLGSPKALCPSAMANLLGDLWSGSEPDWLSVCAYPNLKLHLYGKMEARPGRKMGHLTALGEGALDTVRAAHARLTAGSLHQPRPVG